MEKQYFDAFYKRFFERIYRFVYYRVNGNRELARDLTQDIFLKAFSAFDRYNPALGESAWIYTIARNHIINAHAKTRPCVDIDEAENQLWASEDARELFLLKDDERQLFNAMQELSKDEARLVQMKYIEGWTFDELSVCLEKSSGTLRVQASRALAKLAIFLRKKPL